MKRKNSLLGVTLSTLLAAYLHADLTHSAEAKKEKAPEFALITFDKTEIKLSDFRGRPVVLKFMASW